VENNGASVAKVALFSGFEKELSYAIPPELVGKAKLGAIVKVPLRNTSARGVITQICEPEQNQTFKLKPLDALVREEKALTPDLLNLCLWMRDYYGCGAQSVFESVIPAVVRGDKGELSLKELSYAGDLPAEELERLKKRAPKQYAIIERFLKDPSPVLKSALDAEFSAAASNALIKKGALKEAKRVIRRGAYEDALSCAESVSAQDHVLNAEQSAAFADICGLLDKRAFGAHLLYGVTGSGKTEVYIRAMKRVLKEGGSCIFLVPEISLTPQTVGRLRSRLGDLGGKLVVWHSHLSDGERLDSWKELANGEARVVVGARSCVFAPLENIRLIIVDEEHDGAYKQDKAPRYSARDVAILRAKFCGALCLLGSATPSLETLYNTKNGKYTLSKISKRIDGCTLPTVLLADMRHERGGAVLSRILQDKIGDRLEKSEQSILFLNRRGYAKIFECPDCDYVEVCPHCAVSLTWHRKEDKVKCHICGFEARAPLTCKNCGSERVKWKGHGTQKVEELVAKLFPQARIGRMDADAMNRKDNYRKVLGDFRLGKLDILIGTQMIAKGLDFPRVTLVGLIDADISLHMPDFRAAERTYQLIVQVAGRAGRGDGAGEVVVQTRAPDAAPIQYAKRDDMEAFLEAELTHREEFNYPPFRRVIIQVFKCKNPEKADFYAEHFAKEAEAALSGIAEMRGPSAAPIEKIEDFYIRNVWYFCHAVRPVVAKLLQIRKDFKMDEEVTDYLDVDPF